MKLSRKIQMFFSKDEFCYPIDFFWINKDRVVKQWRVDKIICIAALILYYIFSTLAFLGYYILLPFRLLHEWCEEWCYK